MEPNNALARHGVRVASLSALALLGLLVALTMVGGVSQQTFERIALPADFARGLREGAKMLRIIIAIDDVFIVAYTTATLLLVRALGRLSDPIWCLTLLCGLTAGVLDMHENHHILSMLTRAELGALPTLTEIESRYTLSSLKWLSGHVSFVLLGTVLEVRGALRIPVRVSLIGVQLTLGVAALVVVEPSWIVPLALARYGAVLSGFALLAFLMGDARAPRLPSSFAADGSGAPA